MPQGGSGFSFHRADVMAMGLGEIISHLEWLDEQRKREARSVPRVPQAHR